MSDQGTYFLNQTIELLIEEFQIYHQKSTPYHPQENGTVEAFNKILENALTKVCNANKDELDVRILAVLWAYRTTCKKLTGHTPFKLAYGQEVVMPMEYIVPSLKITTLIDMADEEIVNERLLNLVLTGVKIPRNKGGHCLFHKSQLDSQTFGMAGPMGLWTHYHLGGDLNQLRSTKKKSTRWVYPALIS